MARKPSTQWRANHQESLLKQSSTSKGTQTHAQAAQARGRKLTRKQHKQGDANSRTEASHAGHTLSSRAQKN